MDYGKHYTLLIERAKNRQIIEDVYYEKHHILPRCLGGTDDSSNIVLLKPEEHYLAHQLLVKIYPNEAKLVYAANMMTVEGSGQEKRSQNKRYSWLKKRYISECRKRVGNKNPSYNKKWYYNPETLENKKLKYEDVPENWLEGRVLNGKVKYCLWCKRKLGTDWKTGKNYCNSQCKKEKREYGKYRIFLNLYPQYKQSNLSLRKFHRQHIDANNIPFSTLAKIFKEFKAEHSTVKSSAPKQNS
jgi:hypothetical protein